MQAPEPESAGVNWYWLAVLVSCLTVPFASSAFCDGWRRGQRPYFEFMLGYMCISVPVFLAGVARAHRYHRANLALVPLIVAAWVVVGALQLLMGWAANFEL